MKTHGILKAEKSESSVTKKMKNALCKCIRTIFQTFWFCIYLHYRNQYSTIDFFSAIPATPLFVLLINMPLCKQADGGGGNGKISVIGTFCVVLAWIISFHGWKECPLLKYPWAKYCNDLSVVAVHKDVLCACIILFNACACLRLLLKLALWNQQQWTKNKSTDRGFNRKRCSVILQKN